MPKNKTQLNQEEARKLEAELDEKVRRFIKLDLNILTRHRGRWKSRHSDLYNQIFTGYQMLGKSEKEITDLIESRERQPKYVAPSRVGKRVLHVNIEPEAYEAFKELGMELGFSLEYMAHKAIKLALVEAKRKVPEELERRLADTVPRKPGRVPKIRSNMSLLKK